MTDHEPKRVEKFYFVDFDRCLGSVEAATGLLYQAADEAGIRVGDMQQTRQNIEATAGSFDVVEWIEEHCSKEQYEAFISNYLSLPYDDESLLEPGAAEFLQRLIQHKIPFMIMTFGGETWQLTKLKRAGLGSLPTKIIDSKEKGAELANWEDADTHDFKIPGNFFGGQVLLAHEVVLIDDKAAAFKGLPNRETVRGYQLMHGHGEAKPSQMGELPSNVQLISSFDEIASREGIPPLKTAA